MGRIVFDGGRQGEGRKPFLQPLLCFLLTLHDLGERILTDSLRAEVSKCMQFVEAISMDSPTSLPDSLLKDLENLSQMFSSSEPPNRYGNREKRCSISGKAKSNKQSSVVRSQMPEPYIGKWLINGSNG